MTSILPKVAASMAVLASIVFGTVAPASAGERIWRGPDFWQSPWRAAYVWGAWDGVIRTGSPDPRIAHAVLGHYPYHDYGYNNGACIGYEWICDPLGNVIGQRPILVC